MFSLCLSARVPVPDNFFWSVHFKNAAIYNYLVVTPRPGYICTWRPSLVELVAIGANHSLISDSKSHKFFRSP